MEEIMNLEINVCLGCYASYNDGYLFDKWYKCEDSESIGDATKKFKDHVLACIEMERPEWVEDGYVDPEYYAEELYLADYEICVDGKLIDPKVGESIYDLQNFLESIEEIQDSERLQLFIEISKEYSYEEALERTENAFGIEIEGNKEYDVGYYFADLMCLFDDAPEVLTRYFDYESYGRDILIESQYYEIDNMIWILD